MMRNKKRRKDLVNLKLIGMEFKYRRKVVVGLQADVVDNNEKWLMRLNVLHGIFTLSPETFYSFLCDVNGAISNWSLWDIYHST